MPRRNKLRYGLTKAECDQHAVKCPDCGARAAWLGGTAGGYFECHTCARQWGWCSRRGEQLTETEYYKRMCAVAKAGGWIPPAPRERPRKMLVKPSGGR